VFLAQYIIGIYVKAGLSFVAYFVHRLFRFYINAFFTSNLFVFRLNNGERCVLQIFSYEFSIGAGRGRGRFFFSLATK